VAKGLDTVAEAFDVEIGPEIEKLLVGAKDAAAGLCEVNGKALIAIGSEDFQMSAKGGKGIRFWLSNDDLTLMIRPFGMDFPVTVRYSAPGLWEHGYIALRERAERAILFLGKYRREDFHRLSEIHVAFDMYSPQFSDEMKPEILNKFILPSGVKGVPNLGRENEGKNEAWFRMNRIETYTISRGKPLEVQIYDKGREITEASGKTWMFDVWEKSGQWTRDQERPMQKHIWRVELRMRSDFLKDRGILTMSDFVTKEKELTSEVILTRRLTEPAGDTNRSRWPLHWFWSALYRFAGEAEYGAPLGRKITQARAVLVIPPGNKGIGT